MAMKRSRIPMVGDSPPQVVERTQRDISSEPDSDFDWDAWAELLVYCLRFQKSMDELLDYWRLNSTLIEYAKKIKPDVFNRVRQNFTQRKEKVSDGKASV